jgi:hypothetical protein
MRRFRLFGLAALVLAAPLTAPTAARADDPAARTEIVGLPSCADDGILATIRDRFAYGAARVERRDLAIATIESPREMAAATAPSPIARRWCSAAVSLSDGTRSRVNYRIDRGLGFAAPAYAGIPDGVEFCVFGHDPWHVHDGMCRTTRRFW